MKKAYFLWSVILLAVVACQKSPENQGAPEQPQVTAGLAVLDTLDCDACINALIDPSCCCVIKSIGGAPICVTLCGTTTPIFPIDPCPGGAPPPSCAMYPVGPAREANIMLNHNEIYTYCATPNCSYSITNCSHSPATLEVRCKQRGGAWGIPVVVHLPPPGGQQYLTVSAQCQAQLCP